ncbi:MAG: hypothetical protein NZM28_02000 [Fimbriimonadales bacterium]|nr:hypothetical protein [Fimbriimonadales bacterium]
MAVEITIRLSEPQAERLHHLAQSRGISVDTLVQETLQSALSEPVLAENDESLKGLEVRFEPLPSGYYRVKLLRNGVEVPPDAFKFIGCARSGTGDVAARHDAFLSSTL